MAGTEIDTEGGVIAHSAAVELSLPSQSCWDALAEYFVRSFFGTDAQPVRLLFSGISVLGRIIFFLMKPRSSYL